VSQLHGASVSSACSTHFTSSTYCRRLTNLRSIAAQSHQRPSNSRIAAADLGEMHHAAPRMEPECADKHHVHAVPLLRHSTPSNPHPHAADEELKKVRQALHQHRSCNAPSRPLRSPLNVRPRHV
jgi:hypothetical protein